MFQRLTWRNFYKQVKIFSLLLTYQIPMISERMYIKLQKFLLSFLHLFQLLLIIFKVQKGALCKVGQTKTLNIIAKLT